MRLLCFIKETWTYWKGMELNLDVMLTKKKVSTFLIRNKVVIIIKMQIKSDIFSYKYISVYISRIEVFVIYIFNAATFSKEFFYVCGLKRMAICIDS